MCCYCAVKDISNDLINFTMCTDHEFKEGQKPYSVCANEGESNELLLMLFAHLNWPICALEDPPPPSDDWGGDW